MLAEAGQVVLRVDIPVGLFREAETVSTIQSPDDGRLLRQSDKRFHMRSNFRGRAVNRAIRVAGTRKCTTVPPFAFCSLLSFISGHRFLKIFSLWDGGDLLRLFSPLVFCMCCFWPLLPRFATVLSGMRIRFIAGLLVRRPLQRLRPFHTRWPYVAPSSTNNSMFHLKGMVSRPWIGATPAVPYSRHDCCSEHNVPRSCLVIPISAGSQWTLSPAAITRCW